MDAALDLLDTKITCIVEGRVVAGLHKSELVQHRIAIASFIKEQLCPGVEGNEKILIRVVTGLNKLRQRFSCLFDLVAAHRARYVEDHAHRYRRIVIAKKGDLLWLFVLKDGESLLCQA